VLHDDDGADFMAANIVSGSLAQGGVGVLYNAAAITPANMQAAWGGGINFIPVASWGNGFGNDGDTVAIWSSIDNYNLDKPGAGRSTAQAAAVATYDDADPWPTNNGVASVFVSDLNLDPAVGGSWVRSGTAADVLGSTTASLILGSIVDHPGGDVGSPGNVPGAAVPNVLGDYNGNHVVDAADYTVWRDAMANGGSLPNDASPGSVSQEDYSYWKSHFGATTSGGGSLTALPEPASAIPWLLAAAAQLAWRSRATRQPTPRALR
jgi:hypothetical protein